MDGTSATRATYLGHPHHSQTIPGDFGPTDHPNSPRTCRGRIKPRELEVSAIQEDLPGHTGASGLIERIEPIGHVVYGPKITQERYTKTVVLGSIEDEHALRQLGHNFPNRATAPVQRNATSLDTLRTTYGTFVLQTFWYTFISIFYPLGQTLTPIVLMFEGECWNYSIFGI